MSSGAQPPADERLKSLWLQHNILSPLEGAVRTIAVFAGIALLGAAAFSFIPDAYEQEGFFGIVGVLGACSLYAWASHHIRKHRFLRQARALKYEDWEARAFWETAGVYDEECEDQLNDNAEPGGGR